MRRAFFVAVLLLGALLLGCVDVSPGPPPTPTSPSTPSLSPTSSVWPSPSPFSSPEPPAASPTPQISVLGAPGSWVNLTRVEEIHAMVPEGNHLWAATNGGVVRWDISDGSYIKYTRADGLHQNKVTAMAMDAQGNKWFGTDDRTEIGYTEYGRPAVSRFDGQSWTTYGTLKAAVEAGYEAIQSTIGESGLWLVDSKGQVWIIHYPGVQVYDGEQWVTYTSPDALVEYNPTAMAMDAWGRVWIGSVYEFGHRQGVSVFDGNKWVQYRPEDGLIDAPINDITADEEGNVWLATGFGVSRFNGWQWLNYGVEDGLSSTINSIGVDASGRVWAATREGVSMFDGENWSTYGLADGFSRESVQALAFDETGRGWFGSYGGHVDSFDGHAWRAYVTEDEIGDSSVGTLATDARGRVWLGNGETLTVFDGRGWTQYTSKDGYPVMPPWGLAADAMGNLWIYGYQGVIKRAEDGSWTVYGSLEEAVEKNYDQILTTLGSTKMWLVEPGGAIWVNGRRYDGAKWTSYEDVLAGYLNPATVGAVDGRGRVWFGSQFEGVAVLDGRDWVTYDADNSSLAHDWIREILVDDEGRVWIATFSGLYAVEGDEWQVFTSDGGLIDDNVLCLAFDHQGRLWVGTVAGISILDGSDWESYPVMDVQDIVVDEHGNVWAGTLFDGVLIHIAGSQ